MPYSATVYPNIAFTHTVHFCKIAAFWDVTPCKVKVKVTLVQALRLCTGLRPLGEVEV